MWVQSLGWEDALEEGMAAHSSILAWRIPWTEEPDGLQSMGSQRVRLFVIPQTVAGQAPLSMGILQARKLEWVAMPSSRESSQPRPRTPALQADSLPSEPAGKPPLFWISFPFRSLQSIEQIPSAIQ